MSRKQTSSVVSRETKQSYPKAEEEYVDFEELRTHGSFRVMTREEKIQEASKPLYLRRYE